MMSMRYPHGFQEQRSINYHFDIVRPILWDSLFTSIWFVLAAIVPSPVAVYTVWEQQLWPYQECCRV